MGVLSGYNSPGSSIGAVTNQTAPTTESKKESVKEPESKTATAASDDNLDDFLNGLDI